MPAHWMTKYLRHALTALIVASLFACSQGQQPKVANPSNGVLPPLPSGSMACPPVTGQTELVARLSKGDVHLTAMSASNLQALVGTSAVACWFGTSDGSFEALFFKDAVSAGGFKVCETITGQRYLYRMSVATTVIDSSHKLYWRQFESVVLVSSNSRADARLRTVFGGNEPGC
jgi:hypothetical protein